MSGLKKLWYLYTQYHIYLWENVSHSICFNLDGSGDHAK